MGKSTMRPNCTYFFSVYRYFQGSISLIKWFRKVKSFGGNVVGYMQWWDEWLVVLETRKHEYGDTPKSKKMRYIQTSRCSQTYHLTSCRGYIPEEAPKSSSSSTRLTGLRSRQTLERWPGASLAIELVVWSLPPLLSPLGWFVAVDVWTPFPFSEVEKEESVVKWGWSEDEILVAFEKNPWFMVASEHKIMRVMEFFVNKMGWDSSFFARSPIHIGFSLEKRIVPRCAVYQVLLSKGLIKNNSFNLTTMLKKPEKWFLTKVVNCNEEEAPELLKLYEEKLALAKFPNFVYYLLHTISVEASQELSVEIGDLKPDPALWHEDNGREPWENRRQDPPGSISGWHLGDAAHRLVANSLQLRANRNGYSSEEKNMCVRSAEVANKQHLEGVKKIAKLEAECQRLRGLVRKKLPGPAALAQMKLEVENLGRDYGETRVRRSLLKPPSPHPPQLPDFSLDSVPKFYKENDFLTERLLAMEEETKMLKKALAMCTSELQASRNICAKTVSKLQILESQLHANNQQKKGPSRSSLQIPTEGSLSQNAISPPSFTSMSEDRNDNERSCTGCWATTAISELSHFKGKNIEKSNKAENENHLELMDDFLEMEKLASNDSNGPISGSAISNNMRSEMANQDTTINPHFHSKEQPELDSLANHESNAELPVPDPQSDIDPLPLMKFQM
ncbi:hypothetical protein HYC85_006941 [Camellia sinensis]|uniref:Uncharacterized protein n=1 Tax=Camellia sinensis TaxID=4442 RepID=A0A7J7HNE9_CAMSI|nr:hypothetical protein HYC85_006941 [Camellia sinensis]